MTNSQQPVDVIIPVFNEQKTLANVIEVVLGWNKAKRLFVIDDASTDASPFIIRRFGNRISSFTLDKNCGKGNALSLGIEKSRSSILLFLDADIIGLTANCLDELCSPIWLGRADMVIGIHNFWGIGRFQPYNCVSGQRALRRNVLLPILEKLKLASGGVEIVINAAYKNKKILHIIQPDVYTLRKIDKWPITYAAYSYVRQFRDFLKAKLISIT